MQTDTKFEIKDEKLIQIGKNNIIHPTSVIGGSAQHRAVAQASAGGKVHIGQNNTIREFVCVNGGTKRPTTLGNHNFILSHVACHHDVAIANKCTVSSNVSLAGFVTLQDGANIGQNTAIHQNVVIGAYTMIGQGASITKHIPPFTLYNPKYGIRKLNEIGLKRNDFTEQDIKDIRRMYQTSSTWVSDIPQCPTGVSLRVQAAVKRFEQAVRKGGSNRAVERVTLR